MMVICTVSAHQVCQITMCFEILYFRNGWGLCIEEDLTHGRSEKCTTFDNEPLSCGNGGEFECLRVEVWCLEEMGHLATFMDSTDEHVEQKRSIFSDVDEG